MGVKGLKKTISLNPFSPKSDLIDFTLSNARRFYSSKGDPLGVKGLSSLITVTAYHACCTITCAVYFMSSVLPNQLCTPLILTLMWYSCLLSEVYSAQNALLVTIYTHSKFNCRSLHALLAYKTRLLTTAVIA